MFTALLQRFRHLDDSAPRRVEVCPPTRGGSVPAGWTRDLRDWLASGWGLERPRVQPQAPQTMALNDARSDFIDALVDVRSPRVTGLVNRIHSALSMRELWHLRPELFDLVACSFDQHEADERLALLNRHFPTRAPRSGFGALDALPK